MMTIGNALAYLSIATPALAFLIRRHFLRAESEPLVFILATLSCYGLLLLSLPFTEAEIEMHMYSFDLDGNGAFDENERTPEAEAAMRRWSSDVGRNFAPCTGLFLAPIWSLVVYGALSLLYLVKGVFRR